MMPRRPAIVIPKIPLFLIASVVNREVKEVGEKLVRIVVKKVKGHYYDISVRTQAICHPLQTVPKADTLPEDPRTGERFDYPQYSMGVADP
jgi:hypothetical protein